MFAALLDTCVLWPSRQRDFLLSLAVVNLYRPLWSSAILDELHDHEIEKLVERHGLSRSEAEGRAARLIEQMRSHFDDAEVRNWEPYDGTFGLPDRDDEHVVAAAVAGHAGAIVTENLKDFPQDKIPPGIEVVEPSEFAANTVAVVPNWPWKRRSLWLRGSAIRRSQWMTSSPRFGTATGWTKPSI
ncbi:PIN domain-containing protein [Kribbella sp. CA-294648]|uniref:PIN domain-containing protein n=1 Tax=Kribbella sp. CA-294648 TaxID=3239948 RepID=UPI003D922DEB